MGPSGTRSFVRLTVMGALRHTFFGVYTAVNTALIRTVIENRRLRLCTCVADRGDPGGYPMSTDAPTISSRGLSRRSFLMAVGSTILGKFLLPDPTAALSGSAPAISSPVTEAEARVAGR